MSPLEAWPNLDVGNWRDTRATLHLWTQVVGKIRLALVPWLNHSWHVPLYVSSRGLTTSVMPHGSRMVEIQFDFKDHVLNIDVSDGQERRVPLEPQPVAQFYRRVFVALEELGVPVAINPFPCEIVGAIRLDRDDVHASYDRDWAQRFWRALAQADRVFKAFRTGFIGKASPVHFFWGSFDLSVTRFSGRRAPLFEGNVPGLALPVMQEAYSHEVSSAGFWPGGPGADEPNFYSYAYPTTPAFKAAAVQPNAARWSDQLGEFLLPYDAVRRSEDPDATLLAFLESTYAAAADSTHWDRAALECPRGVAGRPPFA